MESGSGMIPGLKEKDGGEGKQSNIENTKELSNCGEIQRMELGNLNEKQRNINISLLHVTQMDPQNFSEQKYYWNKIPKDISVMWNLWAEDLNGVFWEPFLLYSDGHFCQVSGWGHGWQVDISAVRTKWTNIPITGLSTFHFFNWSHIFSLTTNFCLPIFCFLFLPI